MGEHTKETFKMDMDDQEILESHPCDDYVKDILEEGFQNEATKGRWFTPSTRISPTLNILAAISWVKYFWLCR